MKKYEHFRPGFERFNNIRDNRIMFANLAFKRDSSVLPHTGDTDDILKVKYEKLTEELQKRAKKANRKSSKRNEGITALSLMRIAIEVEGMDLKGYNHSTVMMGLYEILSFPNLIKYFNWSNTRKRMEGGKGKYIYNYTLKDLLEALAGSIVYDEYENPPKRPSREMNAAYNAIVYDVIYDKVEEYRKKLEEDYMKAKERFMQGKEGEDFFNDVEYDEMMLEEVANQLDKANRWIAFLNSRKYYR